MNSIVNGGRLCRPIINQIVPLHIFSLDLILCCHVKFHGKLTFFTKKCQFFVIRFLGSWSKFKFHDHNLSVQEIDSNNPLPAGGNLTLKLKRNETG